MESSLKSTRSRDRSPAISRGAHHENSESNSESAPDSQRKTTRRLVSDTAAATHANPHTVRPLQAHRSGTTVSFGAVWPLSSPPPLPVFPR
uniref:Uncharacterized protein n=1 Tax=Steinernema glaseri TaxID=37863 RepID=A0A1I7ZHI2_9BILA